MIRRTYIERILRQIYGGQPSDDSDITINLVNNWLGDAISTAAKANYLESIKIDGISYVNNSFYTTFTGLSITKDNTDDFLYNLTLPEIPLGIGKNEGVATLQFYAAGQTSYTAVPLSLNQVTYKSLIRKIPNKITYWPEGNVLRIESVLPLWTYTGRVKMISGGDSTNLDSIINVPQEYFPMMVEYISKMLMMERAQPQDSANDGVDIK